jgi:hypothetical protein
MIRALWVGQMHHYLAEFDFRYSTKDISDRERADKALIGAFR